MRRLRVALLYGVGAYLVGATVGFFLVLQLSGNTHDRELEAAMTSAFFFGPAAAALAFLVGLVQRGPRC